MSLAEITEKFGQAYEGEASPASNVNLLASRVAQAVKAEVYNFLKAEKDKG